MKQPNEAVDQAHDVEEFLRKYPEWQKQIKTLQRLINQANETNDDALIEQYALRRSQPDGLPSRTGNKQSKTESLALALDELRIREKLEQEAALRKWIKDLSVLEVKLSLYDVVFQALTDQEKVLVNLHFHKGYSLRRLATGTVPLADRIPGAPSLYCLGQMKRRVLRNVMMVLAP